MAHWYGHFMGNPHETKVADLEATLRNAVIVFREVSSSEECLAKGKAVRKLAAKLLTARLKLLKAKLYDAEPVIEDNANARRIIVESLRERTEDVLSGGLNEILVEFDAQDLIA